MKGKRLNILLNVLIVIFVILTAFTIALRTFYNVGTIVIGNSMNNTLNEGDLALIKKGKYVKKITYEDVIVFEHGEKEVIKRVIGLPGDHIIINNIGMVFVNDNQLDETKFIGEEYTLDTWSNGIKTFYDVVLGNDEYYVMGDNRKVSYDSRSYGPIKKDCIVGKLKIVYAHGDFNQDDGSIKNIKPIKWILF